MGDRRPRSGASAAPESVVELASRSGGATITTVSSDDEEPAHQTWQHVSLGLQSGAVQGYIYDYVDNVQNYIVSQYCVSPTRYQRQLQRPLQRTCGDALPRFQYSTIVFKRVRCVS